MREDRVARNLMDDKNEPAAVVIIRPPIQPLGREQRVLRGLYQRWPVVAVAKRDDAFDAQQIVAIGARQRAQRPGEVEPGQGGVEGYGKAIDAVAVHGLWP